MLRIQTRNLYSSAVRNAAAVAAKGKSQGFSKKTTGNRPAPKRISSTTLYRNWPDTIHTTNLNLNAQTVTVPTFTPNKLETSLEYVSVYSDKQMKSLRHLGSFKKGQFNELFFKPITLIRKDSTEKILSLLETSNDRRYILTGESGVGKTSLLAQVHAAAIESNNIVINISYPDLFLNGRNDYFYDNNLKLYVQPMYLKSLIRKILKANDETLLSSIKLSKDYKFIKTTLKGTQNIELASGVNTIKELLSVSTNANLRGDQFNAIISELYAQSEVPVYFTVDNFSSMLTGASSAYKDADNKHIHVLDLQIGKTVMDIVAGETALNNSKSAVVLAICGSDRTNRTLPVALGKLPEDPYLNQYIYEPRFVEILKKGNVQEFEVPKLHKDEVQKLIQFYLDSNVVQKREAENKTIEELTDEKYFLSGNGNPRELLKSIVLTHK